VKFSIRAAWPFDATIASASRLRFGSPNVMYR
jgi:hypothetical protein